MGLAAHLLEGMEGQGRLAERTCAAQLCQAWAASPISTSHQGEG
jgi:hypothetical protein